MLLKLAQLSILGKVESGDLLGLLDLLLVRLDLRLQLLHQGLHSLLVLPVLVKPVVVIFSFGNFLERDRKMG